MNGKPKVVFIIRQFNTGGAEQQMLELVIGLKRRGVEVVTLTLAPATFGLERLRTAGVKTLECGVRGQASTGVAALKGIVALRREKPDMIVGFMTHGNLLARWVKLTSPRVHVINSVRASKDGRLARLLYRLTPMLYDHVVVNSRSAAKGTVSSGVTSRAKLSVIENGVNTERYAPDPAVRAEVRAELECGLAFVWMMVARMRPNKDYETLLHAWHRILATPPKPNIKLFLLGDGQNMPRIKALIADLGIADSVVVLGDRGDPDRLMKAADGFVHSTHYEGMPNVVLEASATGLPIVATAVDGALDVLDDGVTGLLVPPRDPDRLSDRMARVMAMPESERRKMGDAARENVVRNYSFEKNITEWERVLSG